MDWICPYVNFEDAGCPVFVIGYKYTDPFHEIPADSFTIGSDPGSTRERDGLPYLFSQELKYSGARLYIPFPGMW
jgi:hypothetical protein